MRCFLPAQQSTASWTGSNIEPPPPMRSTVIKPSGALSGTSRYAGTPTAFESLRATVASMSIRCYPLAAPSAFESVLRFASL